MWDTINYDYNPVLSFSNLKFFDIHNNQLIEHLLPSLIGRAPRLVTLEMASCRYDESLNFALRPRLEQVTIDRRNCFLYVLATMTPKVNYIKILNPSGLNKKRTPVLDFDVFRQRLSFSDRLTLEVSNCRPNISRQFRQFCEQRRIKITQKRSSA